MSKSKTTAFKFYPHKWMTDIELRLCSLAAHGLWFEMLLIMHDSPRADELRWPDGAPMTAAELARLTRGEVGEVDELLRELRDNGLFVERDGVIVSCKKGGH